MNRPRALIVILVVASVLVRLHSAPVYHGAPAEPQHPRWQSLARPFGDELRGSCNAFLSLLARSLCREGLAATGGIPLMNVTDVEREQFWVYDHHTPGVALTTALAFTLFGDCELTSRGVALALSTLTTVLLLLLAARHLGTSGLLAVFAAQVFLPMGWFWSLHLNFEVPTLPFLVAFLILALEGDSTPARRRLAVVALALAFFMDVVALFGLLAVAGMEGRRRGLRAAAGWVGVGVGLVAFWLLWKTLQLGRHGHTESGNLVSHLLGSTMLSPAFDLARWARRVSGFLVQLGGGWPIAILLFESVAEFRRPSRDGLARVFRAALLVALLNVLLPVIQATEHDYYVLYFQVPLALACGRFATRLPRWFEALGAGRVRAAGPVVLALSLIVSGALDEFDRAPPDTEFPSHHRLGRELALAVPDPHTVIVMESPSIAWQLLTLAYYAHRPVLPIGDRAEVVTLRQGLLRLLGLEHAPIVMARDSLWPGRGGVVPLEE